jgi:ring-1,2-phenylacetyl-CoA epoxidase subunit PaaE
MFGAKTRRVTLPRPGGPSKRWLRSGQALARRAVRVAEVIRETPQAVTIVLEAEDGRPFAFKAGQYLTHCFDLDGVTVKRAYSLSSPEGGRIACTVKAIPSGRASEFVLGKLKAGDRYAILGPSGEFTLDLAGEGPLSFLAAGSGITPVIGLIETALARSPDRRIKLVYVNRGEHDIIFAVRLGELRAKHPSLEVTHVLTRPGTGWSGESGRLGPARLAELLELAGSTYYLCGPFTLMDAAEQGLRARGVPITQIHRERFLAAAQPVQAKPTQPQEITFRRSHKLVTQQVGETILEAGLREGLPLPFSCTVGGCGSCKMRVLEGEVALNEPNCLSQEERVTGHTLACSAYALGRLVVDA